MVCYVLIIDCATVLHAIKNTDSIDCSCFSNKIFIPRFAPKMYELYKTYPERIDLRNFLVRIRTLSTVLLS